MQTIANMAIAMATVSAPSREIVEPLQPARPVRTGPRIPGEPGVWVFILGDMIVFALLFGVFMYYRDKQPALFARSQLELHRSFGAINTLLLLTSSLAVVTGRARDPGRDAAAGAGRDRRRDAVRRRVPDQQGARVGSACSARGTSPATNNFFMYFFVLTGIHAFHLLIGMGVLMALFVLSRKPSLSSAQRAFLEGGACFWHMVDMLWIVLFALLYLMH